MQRVQIVGTQRSGSNLLRLMLNQAPEVFAPPSTHLLEVFTPVLSTYGDLTDLASRRALLEDGQELIRRNVLEWPAGAPDLEPMLDGTVSSAVDLLFLFYDSAAHDAGCRSWVCKSLENLHQMEELSSADPSLGFVHLVRDGRDVAISFQDAPIGPKDPYVQARKWVNEQRTISEFSTSHPERVERVSYEDLLASPMETIERVQDRFHLGPVGDVERFFDSEMAQRTKNLSDLWTNLSRPLMRENSRKYLEEDQAHNVAAFEAVAAPTLLELGYELLTKPVSSPIDWDAAASNDARLRTARRQRNDPSTEQNHAHYEEFVQKVTARTPANAGRSSVRER